MSDNQYSTDKIELLRKKMIETAKIHGFSSPVTLKISQELDALLLMQIKDKNSI